MPAVEGDRSEHASDQPDSGNVRADDAGPATGRHVGVIEKARDPRRALTRLLRYLGPFKAVLAHRRRRWCVIYTLLGLVGPYLMGGAIDQFISTKQAAGLAGIALLMLAIYLLNNLFQAIANWVMAGVSQRALKQLRTRPVHASADAARSPSSTATRRAS